MSIPSEREVRKAYDELAAATQAYRRALANFNEVYLSRRVNMSKVRELLNDFTSDISKEINDIYRKQQ
jgi:hypothetical protein